MDQPRHESFRGQLSRIRHGARDQLVGRPPSAGGRGVGFHPWTHQAWSASGGVLSTRSSGEGVDPHSSFHLSWFVLFPSSLELRADSGLLSDRWRIEACASVWTSSISIPRGLLLPRSASLSRFDNYLHPSPSQPLEQHDYAGVDSPTADPPFDPLRLCSLWPCDPVLPRRSFSSQINPHYPSKLRHGKQV